MNCWVKVSLMLFAIPLTVCGCASSTLLVNNHQLSQETKSKGLTAYKEAILIQPPEDPRTLMPRVIQELQNLGYKVTSVRHDQPLEAPQGTAFLISADGYLLTCAHVIGEANEATVFLNAKRLYADVVKKNSEEDLALLKLRDPAPADAVPLGFRTSRPYSMGEEVFTIGYPLSRMLGENARMSRGMVAATTGLKDDPKRLQVSAEVQPGNSGGPLLDREGQVIGVIQQTINPWRVVQSTGGALPQNINFSIKTESVLKFIGESPQTFDVSSNLNHGKGLDKAGLGVAKVLAGIVKNEEDRRETIVVKVNYVSFWDLWYRFRIFVVSVFDFETQEPLFAVGQGRDNMFSNEDVVIRDTFAKFKKAIGTP
jgi:serine protease Do